MLGIAKLKAGILLLVAFFNQGKEAAADGITAMDLFSFIDEASQLPGVIASKDEILAELQDLSPEELAEIHAAVAEKLNIDSVKAEGIVLAAIDALYYNYALVKAITA